MVWVGWLKVVESGEYKMKKPVLGGTARALGWRTEREGPDGVYGHGEIRAIRDA